MYTKEVAKEQVFKVGREMVDKRHFHKAPHPRLALVPLQERLAET